MLSPALALFAVVAQSLAPGQAPATSPQPQRWSVQTPRPSADFWQSAPSQGKTLQSQHANAWLGVSLLDGKGGPSVGQVVEGSPAEHAGLHTGDRLVSIDGKAMGSVDNVIELVGQSRPGTKVDVQVRREIKVALDDGHKSEAGAFLLGVELGAQQRVGDDDAVEIASVLDGWPAQSAGLQAGDELLSVEGKRVASSEHVSSVLKSVREAREVRCEVARKIQVTLGAPRADLALKLAQPRQTQPLAPPPAVQVQPKGGKPRAAAPAAPRARATQPAPQSDQALLDEVRALSSELRELRDQIAALRGQLDQLQRRPR
jgi:membrane-associated protease RseP (regulator of RpoE activity)